MPRNRALFLLRSINYKRNDVVRCNNHLERIAVANENKENYNSFYIIIVSYVYHVIYTMKWEDLNVLRSYLLFMIASIWFDCNLAKSIIFHFIDIISPLWHIFYVGAVVWNMINCHACITIRLWTSCVWSQLKHNNHLMWFSMFVAIIYALYIRSSTFFKTYKVRCWAILFIVFNMLNWCLMLFMLIN